MKKSSLGAAWAVVAAMAAGVLSMGLFVSRAEAQQPTGARAAGAASTALIDVNYIIKNHIRFKSAHEQFEADVKNAQVEWKRQNDGIAKEAEQLQNFRPGTQDYKSAEEDLLNKRMKLQTTVTMQKKDFVQREAKLFYSVYQEILYEVQSYCGANGVSLVLNFQGDKINPDKPDDVIRGVYQPVVFYNRDLDITPLILSKLNGGSRTPVNPGPARTGVGYQR